MKIYIETQPYFNTIKVFAINRLSDGSSYIYLENGKLIEKTIDSSMVNTPDKYKPLIELPRQIFDEVVKEFKKYAENNGLNYEEENKTRGKLEATEKHLQDMRDIVFIVNVHNDIKVA